MNSGYDSKAVILVRALNPCVHCAFGNVSVLLKIVNCQKIYSIF